MREPLHHEIAPLLHLDVRDGSGLHLGHVLVERSRYNVRRA